MVLNNPVYFKAGPVKQPPDNLSREQLDKVRRRTNFSLFYKFYAIR